MNLLAIDTATEACSVALQVEGSVTSLYQVAPQQHAKLLLPMIDDLFATADIKPISIDGLVLGRGPGSFTGVRIAAAAVQAIAMVADCPVVTVSSLASMAHRAWRESQIEKCVAMIDARMQQIYWGCFQTLALGETQAIGEERVSDPGEVEVSTLATDTQQRKWIGLGSGAIAYRDELMQRYPSNPTSELVLDTEANDAPLLPTAVDMLSLSLHDFQNGNTVGAEYAIPTYLRDKVALTDSHSR